MKKNKKLILKKEKIASLSNNEMSQIKGGGPSVVIGTVETFGGCPSNPSTQNGFTCCWCSGGATSPKNCK